jgi:hypothetical protein
VDSILYPSHLESRRLEKRTTDNKPGQRPDEIARDPSETLTAGREGLLRIAGCGKVEESVE